MSDELQRPDDRLPQELAAIEARLAAHALPAPGLNRDELFYQAGWAACEAKQHATPRRLASSLGEPSRPSRTIAAWSAASAALAASLAVAATLALRSNGTPGDRELAVHVDRVRARTYGFSSSEIAQYIAIALRGLPLKEYHDNGTQIPVWLRFGGDDTRSLSDLADYKLRAAD